MDYSSKLLETAVEHIASLPGIGKKTALRLALHILRQAPGYAEDFTESIRAMVDEIKHCTVCNNLCDTEICPVCADPSRQRGLVCVVEDIRDVIAIESTALFRGVYHVLGGKISPMEGISPNDLEIDALVERCRSSQVSEIIFALSATIEGDTTAYYIYKKLPKEDIRLSSIARGVSIGGELQYTDEVTLGRSIQNRIPYEKTLE